MIGGKPVSDAIHIDSHSFSIFAGNTEFQNHNTIPHRLIQRQRHFPGLRGIHCHAAVLVLNFNVMSGFYFGKQRCLFFHFGIFQTAFSGITGFSFRNTHAAVCLFTGIVAYYRIMYQRFHILRKLQFRKLLFTHGFCAEVSDRKNILIFHKNGIPFPRPDLIPHRNLIFRGLEIFDSHQIFLKWIDLTQHRDSVVDPHRHTHNIKKPVGIFLIADGGIHGRRFLTGIQQAVGGNQRLLHSVHSCPRIFCNRLCLFLCKRADPLSFRHKVILPCRVNRTDKRRNQQQRIDTPPVIKRDQTEHHYQQHSIQQHTGIIFRTCQFRRYHRNSSKEKLRPDADLPLLSLNHLQDFCCLQHHQRKQRHQNLDSRIEHSIQKIGNNRQQYCRQQYNTPLSQPPDRQSRQQCIQSEQRQSDSIWIVQKSLQRKIRAE